MKIKLNHVLEMKQYYLIRLGFTRNQTPYTLMMNVLKFIMKPAKATYFGPIP